MADMEELIDRVDRGQRCEALLNEPVVAEYFAKTRTDYTERMVAAETDDQRREFAYRIQALDGLRQHLEGVARIGVVASGKLETVNG